MKRGQGLEPLTRYRLFLSVEDTKLIKGRATRHMQKESEHHNWRCNHLCSGRRKYLVETAGRVYALQLLMSARQSHFPLMRDAERMRCMSQDLSDIHIHTTGSASSQKDREGFTILLRSAMLFVNHSNGRDPRRSFPVL